MREGEAARRPLDKGVGAGTAKDVRRVTTADATIGAVRVDKRVAFEAGRDAPFSAASKRVLV